MANEVNHYEVLGVAEDATTSEIRSAYRLIVTKYHPDKTDDPNELEIYYAASEAKDILANPELRDEYDAEYGLGEYSINQDSGITTFSDDSDDYVDQPYIADNTYQQNNGYPNNQPYNAFPHGGVPNQSQTPYNNNNNRNPYGNMGNKPRVDKFKKKRNWLPWLIGGSIVFILACIFPPLFIVIIIIGVISLFT